MLTSSKFDIRRAIAAAAFGVTIAMSSVMPAYADVTLLNVSYDPTREFYKEFNEAFAAVWLKDTGETVTIEQSHGGSGKQSHGGSGKQARGVIDGLDADVVTLALEGDIDAIASKTKKIPENWKTRLPNDSAPYTSTIVFLVRQGNPKGIRDWGDLVKGDVQIVTPNPKTSGGARWNYLAAWAWADKEFGGDQGKIKGYISELFKRAPVLDSGARGSLTSFAQREIGDVLLAWENEAYLAQGEFGDAGFEIVTPSLSILAQPSVSMVDGNAEAKGTSKVAQAYLEYLYSDVGQTLAAKHHYRPSKPELVKDAKPLPELNLVKIDDPLFGGWKKAQPEHFGDGGVFDQIYKPAQ